MIRVDNLQFAAAPRTGSTWLLHALEAYGIQGQKTHIHHPHEAGKSPHTVRVSLVRHPADWFASYYAAIYPGLIDVRCVDVMAVDRDLSFDGFIKAYLRNRPGEYGRIITAYNADVYLRIEDCPLALTAFMLSMKRKPQKEVPSGAVNATKFRNLPVLNNHLRKAVMEAESKLCESFDYR